ncbi:hypothetical protein HHL16_15815 [Pseudoflavitalea sp. G-6-1-2]|uniref:hypothetical protein n=1 Tax=Pseudoflavitalea sp. G-6-1-2 TaxID=2728841 RepID=UPI001469A087|nr:hypothetical protein [Pseudoflavitalea sp. G-6-1-2]NML22350.1 hypothetical protein [Pseudoflavitalea sp. G-6-1-2]
MKAIEKYIGQLSEKDQKYYRHWLKELNESQIESLGNLTEKLALAGASRPLQWAWSEINEGIPQFARFRFLQELYMTAYDVNGNVDCAHDFDATIGKAYQQLTAAAGKEQLDHFLRSYGKGLLYQLMGVFDEGNVESERDGFSWRLMKTNPETDEMLKGIDGLHEDFMEFDQEITPPNIENH